MSKRWLGLLPWLVWIGGSGVARAALNVIPDPLPFGNVVVLQPKSGTTTLSATGATTATVTVVVGSGGDCSQFQIVSPTTAVTVDATTPQTITVQFTSASTGAKTCTIDVKNASNTTIKSFTATGTGISALATNLSTIDFGPVQRGATQSVTFTLSNPGNAPVTITTSGLDKPTIGYSIDPSTPIPSPINPMVTVPVKVNFAPVNVTDGGVAVFTIAGTWGTSNSASVAVNFKGAGVSFTVTSTPVDFGNFRFDSALTRVFHINNDATSGATVPVATVDFTPDMGTMSTEVPSTVSLGGTNVTLSAPLPAGKTFDVTVTAKPNNRTGMVSGHFTVHSSAPGVPDPTTIASSTGELTLINNDNGKPMATVTLTGDAVFVDAHGGGTCNAGGHGEGGGGCLALGALVLGVLGRRRDNRRRTRRAAAAVASLAVIGTITAIAPAAHAEGIDLTVFAPTPAITSTGFQLQSPDVGEDGSWAASTILSYASNPLKLDIFTGNNSTFHDTPVRHSALLQLGGAYAFLGRFEAGANIPLYMQSGDSFSSSMTSFAVRAASGTARGNLTLHAKARLWRGGGGLGRFVAGTSALVMLPTASKDQFTGSDQPAAKLLLLGAFTPAALSSRLTISMNAGAIVRGKTEYLNIEQQSGVAWGAGASYRILDALWATAEVFGEATPSGQVQQQGTGGMPRTVLLLQPEWLAGVSCQVAKRVTIGIAGGRGMLGAPGTPDLRGVFSLAVSSTKTIAPIHPSERAQLDGDADGDGIPDRLDKCPDQPEDKNGIEDADGCPDLDSDRDGIPDSRDKCPNQPEIVNGVEDADGCPDDVTDQSTSPEASADQSPMKAAEEAFLRGRELLKQKKFFAACAAFEQSQRLDPAAGTQYNLAGCDVEIGKLATALALYRDLAQTDKNAERRVKSDELANQLASRVPRLKLIVKGPPAGVNVVMNGRNVKAQIGVETPLDLGTYTISADAPKHHSWRQTVEVKKEGEVTTIEIDLGPQNAP